MLQEDHQFSPLFSQSPHKCTVGMDKAVLTPCGMRWHETQGNYLCQASVRSLTVFPEQIMLGSTPGCAHHWHHRRWCKEGSTEKLEVKFPSLCKESLHFSTASVKGACSGLLGHSALQIHKFMLAVEGAHSWHQRQGKNKTRTSLTKVLQFFCSFF